MAAAVVRSRYVVILYKKVTEVCQPYPIAHALVVGDDFQALLDNPPKAKGHPRYAVPWRRMGAPIRQMSYCTRGDPNDPESIQVTETPHQPIKYLQPQETKEEVKVKVRGATGRLAKFFVGYYLQRGWTKADYGGMHMAHAKKILALGYTVEQVVECLQQLARGDLTDGVPWVEYTTYHNFRKPGWSTLLCVLWGEPPIIEREPNTITNLNMTPEQWVEWREARKTESAIVDEPPEETALRDFKKRPGWAEDNDG